MSQVSVLRGAVYGLGVMGGLFVAMALWWWAAATLPLAMMASWLADYVEGEASRAP